MKKYYLFLFLGLFCLISTPAVAVHKVSPLQKEGVKEAVEKRKEEWKKMSRKEKKAVRKQMRKDIRTAIKEHKKGASDSDTLLLVILAILIPPLAMGLYDGITDRFWISLLLTLLLYLPGLIYTLVIILGER